MTTLLIVFQIILAIILTISVLLQKSSSIGLGVYSGSNESLFGAKGPAGFMAKFTMFVGVLFILNTLTLGLMYSKGRSKSILDNVSNVETTIPAANTFDTSSPFESPLNAPAAPNFPSNQK